MRLVSSVILIAAATGWSSEETVTQPLKTLSQLASAQLLES